MGQAAGCASCMTPVFTFATRWPAFVRHIPSPIFPYIAGLYEVRGKHMRDSSSDGACFPGSSVRFAMPILLVHGQHLVGVIARDRDCSPLGSWYSSSTMMHVSRADAEVS